jgi:hypothetical protein
LLLLMQIFNLSIISIAVLENVPPDAGLQKRADLTSLMVGPAGTEDQTRATCVAGSGASRSAIHYTTRLNIRDELENKIQNRVR